MKGIFIVLVLVFIYILIRFPPQVINNQQLISSSTVENKIEKPNNLTDKQQEQLNNYGYYWEEEVKVITIPQEDVIAYQQKVKELETIRAASPNFTPVKINRINTYEYTMGDAKGLHAIYYLYKFMDSNGEILIPNNDYVLGYLPCSWINNNQYIGPDEHIIWFNYNFSNSVHYIQDFCNQPNNIHNFTELN